MGSSLGGFATKATAIMRIAVTTAAELYFNVHLSDN